MLELKNIAFRVTDGEHQTDIIKDLSLTVEDKRFVVITGPNGSGKQILNPVTEVEMDEGKILAVPSLAANHVDAALIHEAAIGKIAGEQLVKLMTLGLTEKEDEEQIINNFLK